jgi:hypothetical protein
VKANSKSMESILKMPFLKKANREVIMHDIMHPKDAERKWLDDAGKLMDTNQVRATHGLGCPEPARCPDECATERRR